MKQGTGSHNATEGVFEASCGGSSQEPEEKIIVHHNYYSRRYIAIRKNSADNPRRVLRYPVSPPDPLTLCLRYHLPTNKFPRLFCDKLAGSTGPSGFAAASHTLVTQERCVCGPVPGTM